MKQLQQMAQEQLAWVDIRPDVHDAYNQQMQHEILEVGVWQGDCGGYYHSQSGRAITQWPHRMSEYTRGTNLAEAYAYEKCAIG